MASHRTFSLLAMAASVNMAAGLAAVVAGFPAAVTDDPGDHQVQAAADVGGAVLVELLPPSEIVAPSIVPTTSTPSTTTASASSTTTTTAAPATTTTSTTTTTTAAPPTTSTTVAPSTTTTTTTTPPTTSAPTTTTTAAPPEGSTRDPVCEADMIRWMNEARADRGLPELTEDDVIQHVPLDWAIHMAERDELEHNPEYGDRIFSARPEARYAGENVGRSSGDRRIIFDEFMRSPTHHDVIVSERYSHTDVGCVERADGSVWVSVNFWG